MTERIIIANNLPYTLPTTDAKQALQDTLAFAVNDWAEDRASAWIYGIILGWFDDPETEAEVREEFRQKFGWTGEQIARLEALHEAFEALSPAPSAGEH